MFKRELNTLTISPNTLDKTIQIRPALGPKIYFKGQKTTTTTKATNTIVLIL